jgi:Fe-S cluster biogenesis protein NfuA
MAVGTEIYEKVEKALDDIRPFLIADGGNIELVHISDDFIVEVKLLGACESCKMSESTMKAGVESTIKSAVPEVQNGIIYSLTAKQNKSVLV